MSSLRLALLLLSCARHSFGGLRNAPDPLGDADPDVSVPPAKSRELCKDCSQIFQLLEAALSSADLEKKMTGVMETLCDHLPGPPGTAIVCKKEVEKMLPLAISLITGVLKPEEVCKAMGLCSATCDRREGALRDWVEQALQAAATGHNGEPPKQCSVCLFLLRTLEELLPTEPTESAVLKLLEDTCHILPPSYRNRCQAVVDKVIKTVLDTLARVATPQAICSFLHLCKGQGGGVADQSPDTRAPMSEPCPRTSHRCRDVKTALRCGTFFYCQRFAWEPLDNAL